MDERYEPQQLETKWQSHWDNSRLFKVDLNPGMPKYYLMEMFPYPSGKIHMGHVRNYTIGDVVARYKRMQGFNVLHPMGWDAFGMPAENAAIANKTHPARWTYDNIDNMRAQLKQLGFSYDWDREIATCTPQYYRWEQWLFLKMLEKNMAYRKEAFVNWCETCQTVLANEQVEAGACWRCGRAVRQKKLWQWFFRITDYAEDLLMHCDQLPGWPEKVTTMQKNWIGRSQGAEIQFPIEGQKRSIPVFTTRPDTVFGATFMCLAPEHPLVVELSAGTEHERQIQEFIERVSLLERTSKAVETYEKEGVFTGAYCINPMNGRRMPIYTANFALMEYGTGAVMSVPAHDQRDFDFARKYGLEIVVVVNPADQEQPLDGAAMAEAFTADGIMVNSDDFNDLPNREAMEKIIARLESEGTGKGAISYRLRDWGISRQRYWGAPIPVVHCPACGIVPAAEKDLPILLPEDADLLEGGRSPLPALESFVRTICPTCGRKDARPRNRYHGHLCGVLLVLRALLQSRLQHGHVRKARRGLLDACGSIHRRCGARHSAPALLALLHPGAQGYGIGSVQGALYPPADSGDGVQGNHILPPARVSFSGTSGRKHRRTAMHPLRAAGDRGPCGKNVQVQTQRGGPQYPSGAIRSRHHALVLPFRCSARTRPGVE